MRAADKSAPRKASSVKPARAAPKLRKRADSAKNLSGAGRASLRAEVATLKREMLLRAASEVIFERGYQATTVDMITAKLSGTKSIFYYLFEDKRAVLEAIGELAIAGAELEIRAAIKGGSTPVDALRALAGAYAAWVVRNRVLVGVFWREERNFSAAFRRRAAIGQKRIDDLIADVLSQGAKARLFDVKDFGFASRAITGMITFSYTWWQDERRINTDTAAEMYALNALRIAGYSQAL